VCASRPAILQLAPEKLKNILQYFMCSKGTNVYSVKNRDAFMGWRYQKCNARERKKEEQQDK
jgi:hypothetical protein